MAENTDARGLPRQGQGAGLVEMRRSGLLRLTVWALLLLGLHLLSLGAGAAYALHRFASQLGGGVCFFG